MKPCCGDAPSIDITPIRIGSFILRAFGSRYEIEKVSIGMRDYSGEDIEIFNKVLSEGFEGYMDFQCRASSNFRYILGLIGGFVGMLARDIYSYIKSLFWVF